MRLTKSIAALWCLFSAASVCADPMPAAVPGDSKDSGRELISLIYPELLTYPAPDGRKPAVQRALEIILADSGMAGQIDVIPEQRAVEKFAQDPLACRFMDIAPSKAQGLPVAGTLITSNLLLASRKGADLPPIHRLEDAKGLKVGIAVNKILEDRIRAMGITPDVVRLESLNFAKLEAGRIDLWLTRRATLERMVRAGYGLMPETIWESAQIEYGIVCNRAFPEVKRLALQEALARFRPRHRPDLSDLE